MGSGQGIRAGRAFIELGVDDRMAAGLRAAQHRLKTWGKSLAYAGAGIGAAGAAITAPLIKSLHTFASVGGELEEMSARTGMAVESLSALSYAADLGGSSLDAVEVAIRRMQKSLAASGKFGGMKPEEQFAAVAEELSKIADPTERAAAAMKVFGRSGTSMLPMIENGLAAAKAEAESLGLILSTKDARAAHELEKSWTRLSRGIRGISLAAASSLADTITKIANAAAKAAGAVAEWVRANKPLVMGVAAVGVALTVLGSTLAGAGFFLIGIGAALGVLATAMTTILPPIFAVGSALFALERIRPGSLADAWAGSLKWLGDNFGWLRDTALTAFQGIADAMAAGDMQLAGEVLWDALKVVWYKGAQVLNGVWAVLKNEFVTTAYDMWYGATAAGAWGWAQLKIAWAKAKEILGLSWGAMAHEFTSASYDMWYGSLKAAAWGLAELQGMCAKAKSFILKLFQDDITVTGIPFVGDVTFTGSGKGGDKDKRLAEELTAAKTAYETAIAEAESNRVKAQAALETGLSEKTHAELVAAASAFETDKAIALAEYNKAKAGYEAARLSATAGADADLNKRIADAQGKFDAAKSALDVAAAKAKAARVETEAAAPKYPDKGAGAAGLVAAVAAVAGTFNPLTMRGIGASAALRTAKGVEQIVRNTAETNAKLDALDQEFD